MASSWQIASPSGRNSLPGTIFLSSNIVSRVNMLKAKLRPIDRQLREAIATSNQNLRQISLGAGVSPSVMHRFVKQGLDIRLAIAARIAMYLGLELVKVTSRAEIAKSACPVALAEAKKTPVRGRKPTAPRKKKKGDPRRTSNYRPGGGGG